MTILSLPSRSLTRQIVEPPVGFKPVGDLEWARFDELPPLFVQNARRCSNPVQGPTRAQRNGIRFEKKAQEHIEKHYSDYYLPSPWITYQERYSRRVLYAQPDGLLVDPWGGYIGIIEIKLKHCELAWWQLKYKYLPLLQHIFDPSMWNFSLIELVRWYDPMLRMPQRPELCHDLMDANPNHFNVHIYEPDL